MKQHLVCRKREGMAEDGEAVPTAREKRKRRRKAVRQKRKEYYELGAFYGKPATFILLNLAQRLQQADNHSIW